MSVLKGLKLSAAKPDKGVDDPKLRARAKLASHLYEQKAMVEAELAGKEFQPTRMVYFVAKDLQDRATAFQESIANIDRGIGFLEASLDAGEAMMRLYQQMKGLAEVARGATASERKEYAKQFDQLRKHVGLIAQDATYLTDTSALNGGVVHASGIDMNNNTVSAAYREFSTAVSPSADLKIDLKDWYSVPLPGLELNGVLATGGSDGYTEDWAGFPGSTPWMPTGAAVWSGPAGLSDDGTKLQIGYGVPDSVLEADIASAEVIRAKGTTDTLGYLVFKADFKNVGTANVLPDGNYVYVADYSRQSGTTCEVMPSIGYGHFSDDWNVDDAISDLDKTMANLRGVMARFSGTLAILKVRREFNMGYANTLTEGAEKLAAVDLNAEAATVVALQTRQQLSLQAMSLAATGERSVLNLLK